MHGLIRRIRRRGIIPVDQQFTALTGRQDFQRRHRQRRAVVQRLRQTFHSLLEIAHDAFGGELWHREHVESQRIAKVIHRDRQRIIGPLLEAVPLHRIAFAGRIDVLILRLLVVAIVKQHVELFF